jgi:hypothetical protein
LISQWPAIERARPDQAPSPQPIGSLSATERAVFEAVCYGDVFDWPLTPAEVHRYLPIAAGRAEVDAALESLRLRALLHRTSGFVGLVGRSALVRRRRAREAESARRWPGAVRAARLVAGLPFVRLVAISGSLAVSASAPRSDIDLFVVTENGRLWLTRAMTVALVRLAGAAGLRLCPNYFVSESALALPEHDLFTAHELMQMVPIAGHDTYAQLLAWNPWARGVLPNAKPALFAGRPGIGRLRRGVERVLRARRVDRLERWEMNRKIARFTAAADASTVELRFSATVCKGHFEGHRARALGAYEERLARLDGAFE